MSYEVLVDHISFARDERRGEDGAVWYLVLGEPNERVTCSAHPGRAHHYERQAFRRGGAGHRSDASRAEIAAGRANVWGWDGNAEAPTITPSFLAKVGRPYCLHSFIRAERLELCGDSTVALSSAPPCWDEP